MTDTTDHGTSTPHRGSRGTRPPGGAPPPEHITLRGARIALRPLADEACERYLQDAPADLERYGPAARDWCVHDSLYLLAWMLLDIELQRRGALVEAELTWLARVLAARGFPLERLQAHVGISGDVLAAALPTLAPDLELRVAAGRAAVEAVAAGTAGDGAT